LMAIAEIEFDSGSYQSKIVERKAQEERMIAQQPDIPEGSQNANP
jgi:hypothetical protein